MQHAFAVTGLLGCSVEASDGRVGVVKDFLFDDEGWRIRWMEVDAVGWLSGRKVLIHPSAIEPLDVSEPSNRLPMMSGQQKPVVSVRLTKQQIQAGPATPEDAPVTKQVEVRLYEYFGWDPAWGASYFRARVISKPTPPSQAGDGGADPDLMSAASVKGYHVHATDGDLGHIENLLGDDANWDIRYLVIATRNWLPGKHVQMAPFAVTGVDAAERRVDLKVTREQVKSAPEWDPIAIAGQAAEQSLHRHFGWPGYGW